MKVALAHEMQEIDRLTQEQFGLSGDLLMERAALAICSLMQTNLGVLAGKRILVFCGKGNNGGDGLALARLLQAAGAAVWVILLTRQDQLQGLAKINLERALRYEVPLCFWPEIAAARPEAADLMVDAILGTGASGVPKGAAAEAIAWMNAQQKPVWAVDLPSGVAVDSGRIEGVAVRARHTVSFGLAKPGLLSYPGAEYVGELHVAEIGFPAALLNSPNLQIECLDGGGVKQLLPSRPATAHKGVTGHVLVVGGNAGTTGAAALSALGALRSGCGLVTVGLRPGLSFVEKPAELMTVGWPDLAGLAARCRAVVFGPGLGTAEDGRILLDELGKVVAIPLIIDADGLNLIARARASGDALWENWNAPLIFTPHPGEMARLTGLSTAEIQQDRLQIARHYAREWRATVVLKGARTVIAAPDGRTFLNGTGNPGMASAGMGDVLAGVIGGLAAQGMEATAAAAAGAYLHGLAGDLAAQRLGPAGIIAGDLLTEIPRAINKIGR